MNGVATVNRKFWQILKWPIHDALCGEWLGYSPQFLRSMVCIEGEQASYRLLVPFMLLVLSSNVIAPRGDLFVTHCVVVVHFFLCTTTC